MNKKEERKFIKECNKHIDELQEKIDKGEVKITTYKERIITPDQCVPHQFGYCSAIEPNGNRERRYF